MKGFFKYTSTCCCIDAKQILREEGKSFNNFIHSMHIEFSLWFVLGRHKVLSSAVSSRERVLPEERYPPEVCYRHGCGIGLSTQTWLPPPVSVHTRNRHTILYHDFINCGIVQGWERGKGGINFAELNGKPLPVILHPHRCLCCNAVDSFKVNYISSYKLEKWFVIKIQI